MDSKRYAGIFVLCMGLLWGGNGNAQEDIFSLGMQIGSGARAIAMGGAYSSVGGDYSASLWNPATLAGIKRIEVYGSLSHLARQNNFGLQENTNFFSPAARENEENFTKFNDIGLAYPVPTVQGSLVFSFGFNRVRTYDSNFDFRAFNNTDDDLVNQAWREIETGSLNTWTIAGAMDVSPNVSLGVGLNFWTGGTDFESTFREQDRDDLYTFDSFTVENTLDTEITGFNLRMGGHFRVSPILHLGAAISTPVTFKVKEDWSFKDEIVFDDATFSDSLDTGFFEYKLQSPWTFTGGASLHLLNFVFSGELEYNDWSQIRYETAPPFTDENGVDVSKAEANRVIRDEYRATTRLRLGGEFTLPLTGLSFRAGYFNDPSVFQNADTREDKQFLSAGVGLLVDKQVRLDVAFVHGFWTAFGSELDNHDALRPTDVGKYEEDIKVNKVFVSLAFRF